jgi:aminoglycoside 6'-N-acetyltransferase
VEQWWHESLDLAGVAAKYEPRIEGTDPTHVYMIDYEARPLGWIQWYRWSDYPKHSLQLGAATNEAGLDLAIGERAFLGKGLGVEAIKNFISKVISQSSMIRAVVTDPENTNLRSLRAFEKAGFQYVRLVQIHGEDFSRRVMRIELTPQYSFVKQ